MMTNAELTRSIGTYEITGQLGEGSFGTVFSAYQPFLERQVAIKTLHDNFFEHGLSEKLFIREGQVIARLRHPNIINIYEFGIAQDSSTNRRTAFMIMEYLSGGTLETRLAQGALSIEESVHLVEQIAEGLSYAHERNVIHRDLKPANILFTNDDQPVIVDFGLAKFAQNTHQESSLASATTGTAGGSMLESTITGTPLYASPEQLTGKPVTTATDQYALAMISFQMLTGTLPVSTDNLVELLNQRLRQVPPRILDFAPHLPPAIDMVFQRALAPDPADRFPSVAAFSKAFSTALLPDRLPERVIKIVDPLQAVQIQTARRYITGALTIFGLFVLVVSLYCASEFVRSYLSGAAPEFMWDGLIMSTVRESDGSRMITGVMPDSVAAEASYQPGDKIQDDLVLDKSNPNGQFTVNGTPRAALNVDWKPKPGDVIARQVQRGNGSLTLTYTLRQNPYQMVILGATLLTAIIGLLCGFWLLRRWGPESSLQVFIPLAFVFGFFIVARSVANLILYLDTFSFHLVLAALVHLILVFPEPIDWIKKHPRMIGWVYAPVSVGLYYLFTHTPILLPVINIPLQALDYLLASLVILVLLVFKWLRHDVKLYPGLRWLIGGFAFGMGMSIYYALTAYVLPVEVINNVLGGATVQVFVNDIVLVLLLSVIPILATVGMHRVQKQIGSTLVIVPEAGH